MTHASISTDFYDVERIVDEIGYSRFNLVPLLILMFNTVVSLMNILVVTFSVYIPPDYVARVCHNESVVNNSLVSEYSTNRSMMLELNLICSSSIVANLASLLFFVMGLGSFMYLWLSDKFGRRVTLLLFNSLAAVSHALAYFANSAAAYLAVRCVCGISQSGTVWIFSIYLNETFSASRRYNINTLFSLAVPAGYCLMGLSGYLITSWRNLHLLIAALYALVVALLFLMPESLRWLAAQKEIKYRRKLEHLVKNALNVNNLDEFVRNRAEADGLVVQAENENREAAAAADASAAASAVTNTTPSPGNPWRSWSLWRRMLPVSFAWFTIAATYWAISLSITDLLTGDRSVNLALIGISIIPSMAMAALVERFLSRRGSLSALFCGSAGSFVVSAALQAIGWKENHSVIFWFTIAGQIFIGGAMIVNRVATPEAFPTDIRSRCVGACGSVGRLATCFASFASLVVRVAPLGFPAIAASFTALAGGVVWTMAETKGVALPQSMKDIGRESLRIETPTVVQQERKSRQRCKK